MRVRYYYLLTDCFEEYMYLKNERLLAMNDSHATNDGQQKTKKENVLVHLQLKTEYRHARTIANSSNKSTKDSATLRGDIQ
jgi:hypothetical protein